MIGFFGKAEVAIDLEGHGQLLSGNRYFGVGVIASKAAYIRNERFIFDLDGSGPTPNLSFKTSLGSVAYDNKVTYMTSLDATAAFSGSTAGGFLITGYAEFFKYQNAWCGVAINGSGALTPATRKSKLLISRPEYVSGLSFAVINNGGFSATSNIQGVSPFTLNLRGLPVLKNLYITNIWAANLTVNVPQTLERFYYVGNATSLTAVLPASTKAVHIGSPITSVTSILANCVNCEVVSFGHPAGGYNGLTNVTSTLSGALDLSHMPNLQVFTLPSQSALTSLVLHDSAPYTWIHIESMNATVRSTFSLTPLNNIISGSTGKILYINNCGLTWSRALTDSDLTNMGAYFVAGNSISGNISLTTARPNLREFKTGNQSTRFGSQLNSHPTVNITGLTAVAAIDLSGCQVSDLTLPANTVCLQLILGDNALSITTNPNLLTQINAMTALTTIRFAVGSNGAVVLGNGQSSGDGLGANPTFTGSALTFLDVNNCKITGTLTLPTGNVFQSLLAGGNTGMTSIVNLNKTSIASLQLTGLTNLTGALSISNATGWSSLWIDNCAISSFDASGKTSANETTGFGVTNCSNLTSISFPSAPHASARYRDVAISNNASLTSIPNFDLTYPVLNSGFGVFTAQNCSLNITFPFGLNNCIWRSINVSNNAMSQANVDATIDNIYQNRTKFNVWLVAYAKSLNIAGTNAAPTGTYQAPSGFVLGVSDGTPASVKEMVYVLVNNYSWTITMN